jgi:hypothetical protein
MPRGHPSVCQRKPDRLWLGKRPVRVTHHPSRFRGGRELGRRAILEAGRPRPNSKGSPTATNPSRACFTRRLVEPLVTESSVVRGHSAPCDDSRGRHARPHYAPMNRAVGITGARASGGPGLAASTASRLGETVAGHAASGTVDRLSSASRCGPSVSDARARISGSAARRRGVGLWPAPLPFKKGSL